MKDSKLRNSPEFEKMIKKCARHYILFRKCTFNDLAKRYCLSKGTISKYFKNYLPTISPFLYKEVEKKKSRVAKDRDKRIKKINDSKK